MNVFPETRGASLLTVSSTGEVSETPIIGWCYVQGNRCDPLFAVPRRLGCAPNEGIRTVNELGVAVVSVPHDQSVYSEDDWLAEMNMLSAAGAFDDLEKEAKSQPAAEKKATAQTNTVAKDGAPVPINFDNDAFKTKSYWSMADARAVFSIEKNMTHPADKRCEKVTRDEFASLKRDGYKVIDPHTYGTETAEEPETETPEEAEDDGSDLI